MKGLVGRLVGVLKSQWLLTVTLLLYLWAFAEVPAKACQALAQGGRLLLSVALLVVAVMGLVGLVQVWVSRDAVARVLGREGGWRALAIAALCGTLLIGPSYVIFPLLMTVRRQGARWAVIAVILAAYAVKVPMIPLEVGFLGWEFSLGRSLLTLAFALPIGLAVEWVMEGRPPAGKATNH